MKRALAAALAVGMVIFGVSVYQILDSLKGKPPGTHRPVSGEHAAVALPGVMYVTQGGALYRFQGGVFKSLTKAEGWTQPALSPDGSQLVAVRRYLNHSDLYLLDTNGHVIRQLTHNASGIVENNHWSFYPRFGPSQTLFYSFDPKDPSNNYRVDLAVYSMPLSGGTAHPWTAPNHYTGGDVAPIPLKSGSLLYSKYEISDQGAVYSQLWIQSRALASGAPLTAPEDDCGQPALSADATMVAMVCSHPQAGNTTIELAPLLAASFRLGPRQVLATGPLVAAPVFSPDGTELAYMAPDAGGGFQLWTVGLAGGGAAAPSPSASPAAGPPRQVTSGLAFDSAATPAWAA